MRAPSQEPGRPRRAIWLALATVVALLAAPLVSVAAPASPAVAANAADFNPGNIISDGEFFDANAMSQEGIQQFLDAKIGRCLNGQCLNVARVNPPSYGAAYSASTGNLICGAISGGDQTVAAWLYKVQVACTISAKVVLVMLQKEQSLATDDAPGSWALQHAMGMACPDTAPCDSAFAGLATQIYYGTRQLKTYSAAQFARQPGIQSIQYSPNASCGSVVINVQNYATAALYSYTPYTPNAAALANLYGYGDGCSAYGNRNFFVYYSDWFGFNAPPPPQPNALPALGDPGLLAFAVRTNGELWEYAPSGSGTWKDSGRVTSGWGGVRVVAGGDFDGDGRADLVAEDASGRIWLYPRDGAGGWKPGQKIGEGWLVFSLVAGAGDFNGDGRPDIVARDSAGVMWLYRSLGAGSWMPRVKIGRASCRERV